MLFITIILEERGQMLHELDNFTPQGTDSARSHFRLSPSEAKNVAERLSVSSVILQARLIAVVGQHQPKPALPGMIRQMAPSPTQKSRKRQVRGSGVGNNGGL